MLRILSLYTTGRRRFRMFGRASSLICLSALTLAVGQAAFSQESGPPELWSRSLLILGLATMFCWVQPSLDEHNSSLSRMAIWAALLFPVYVAFQLIPMPVFLLQIMSPMRAEVAGALREVMPMPVFSPLSVAPSQTWVHLSRITGYGLVFLLVWRVARRLGENIWWAVAPLMAFAALEAGLGLAQHFAGATAPISGSYENRNHFAGLLEMLLPFLVMYAVFASDGLRLQTVSSMVAALKTSGVLAIGLGAVLAITFSMAKMGFVAMLASFLVMSALGLGTRFGGWKRWAAIGALTVAFLLVFIFLPPNELVQAFRRAVSEGTGEGRWPIWKDTLHLITDYPFFGCGMGGYFAGLLRYQTAELASPWTHAHNDYLQLLSELGIVGFLVPAASDRGNPGACGAGGCSRSYPRGADHRFSLCRRHRSNPGPQLHRFQYVCTSECDGSGVDCRYCSGLTSRSKKAAGWAACLRVVRRSQMCGRLWLPGYPLCRRMAGVRKFVSQ